MRQLTNGDVHRILEKGERLPSWSVADNLTQRDMVAVGIVSLVLLAPFVATAYPRGRGSAVLEVWLLVVYPFTVVGVGLGWARWRDYWRRSACYDQLERRISKIARTGLADKDKLALASIGRRVSRDEVAIFGDRLVKIRTEPTERNAPSWEALFDKELAVEELERAVGLRQEELEVARLRERLANTPRI